MPEQQQETTGFLFDPFDPGFQEDPYPTYHRVRRQAPFYRTSMGWWLLSRYEDIATVLRDRRFGVGETVEFRRERLGNGIAARLTDFFPVMMDEPGHMRMRTLIAKAFTSSRMEALRPRVEQIVGEILDVAGEKGGMDVVDELGFELPARVISDMLGVPGLDYRLFKDWMNSFFAVYEPKLLLSPDRLERCDAAGAAMKGYFENLIRSRQGRGGGDLISALLAVEEQGDRLSEEQVVAVAIALMSGGFETTMATLSLGVLALLRHPEQARLLAGRPELASGAVEEFLRYDAPLQIGGRSAQVDLELSGQKIRKGDVLVVLFGAGNRDPEQFPDPDRLDITRKNVRPLTFGGGLRFCLGAPLARIEIEVALRALFTRFPGIAPRTTSVDWRPSFVLRCPERLEVSLGVRHA